MQICRSATSYDYLIYGKIAEKGEEENRVELKIVRSFDIFPFSSIHVELSQTPRMFFKRKSCVHILIFFIALLMILFSHE